MLLQCGCPSGRLPRYARNDTVLRTEHNKGLFADKYSQTLRTLFMLSRATHLMSLRGATRRGNLPEGFPCYNIPCTAVNITIITVNYYDLQKKLIFKKIFKKFELNKPKNGGFPKSGFPFLPENTSVLTKRRRFCIIKL